MRLDLSGLRALRVPDPVRLDDLARPEAVLIVGSTCVGKTTLVEAIRASELHREGLVDVPRRFVTRPARRGDCLAENVHISDEEFDRRVARGEVALDWVRPMENESSVRYGFARARRGALPVYSANNAILSTHARLRADGMLAHALVVGVYAPDDVREVRLRRRSPDLCADRPDEVKHRLADPASSILGQAHVIVENHGALEALAPREVVTLLERVVAARPRHVDGRGP